MSIMSVRMDGAVVSINQLSVERLALPAGSLIPAPATVNKYVPSAAVAEARPPTRYVDPPSDWKERPERETGVPLRVRLKSAAVNVVKSIRLENVTSIEATVVFRGSGVTSMTSVTDGELRSITQLSEADPLRIPGGVAIPLADSTSV